MSNNKDNLYYAIRNKKTGKYVSGTDFRYSPPHQISASEYRPPLLFAPKEVLIQIRHRSINTKRYELVTIYMPKEDNREKVLL